jgi:PilZ domain
VTERRITSRAEVLQSAKILLRAAEIPCAIRNLSATGACLIVETTLGIPPLFQLVRPNQTPVTCKVRWRRSTTMGVIFP